MIARFLPESGAGRILASITLVNTIGTGLWVTSSALYLTRIVGLRATDVGIGFTVGALVCLIASTPMGYLADQRGPRTMQILFYLGLAGSYAAMLTVHSLVAFIIVASLTSLADAGQRGARAALIAGTIPKEQRVRTRALFRATANVGYTIGSAAGGVGLAFGTATSYRLLILGNVLSYLGVALLATRLPELAPAPRKQSEPRLTALRDRPYLSFVILDGMMSMHNDILSLVLPLWIVGHTHAPRWMAAVCILVNTVMVVLLQVRTSRGTEELTGAARASRTAGLLIAGACLVFAASSDRSAVTAAALLVLGAFIHVLGELKHSAAGWGISFGLAREDAQGQYLATYAMGAQLGRMLAPAVLTFLVLGWGGPGWIVLAVLVAAPGFAVAPTVNWGRRRLVASQQPVPATP
ncbi:MAG: MFS transporter [Jatrophihabitans sp.]